MPSGVLRVRQGGEIGNKEELHERVDAIECKGGLTNISAGLETARDLLQGEMGLTRRVFLYSDGCANQGLTTYGVCPVLRGVGGAEGGPALR